jgi:hypothetical protein
MSSATIARTKFAPAAGVAAAARAAFGRAAPDDWRVPDAGAPGLGDAGAAELTDAAEPELADAAAPVLRAAATAPVCS